jgi:hypothetical protein
MRGDTLAQLMRAGRAQQNRRCAAEQLVPLHSDFDGLSRGSK